MAEKIIVKVRKNKHSGQKLVTIPMKSDIQEGDNVEVRKV